MDERRQRPATDGRQLVVRDFEPADAAAVNDVALAAFAEFEGRYDDWPRFRDKLARMADLAASAELVVATPKAHGASQDDVLGAVAYVGPGRPKAEFFRPEWPVMRMLVVRPSARGLGIGRALAEACLARARRDGADVVALHTSALMSVARPMYLRMGFVRHAPTPPIHGVAYDVYVKPLR